MAAQLRGGFGQAVEPGGRLRPGCRGDRAPGSRRPGPPSSPPRRTPSRRRAGSRRRRSWERARRRPGPPARPPSASARWAATCSGCRRWTARMALPAARITRRQLASPASRAALASASSLTARARRSRPAASCPARCPPKELNWRPGGGSGRRSQPSRGRRRAAAGGARRGRHEGELELALGRQVAGPDQQRHVDERRRCRTSPVPTT